MASRLPFGIWWSVFVEHRLQRYRVTSWLGRAFYTVRRFFGGARRVKIAGYDGTSGHVEAPLIGLSMHFSGACPIQGDGEVMGFPCYYRSRGEGWSFEVYAKGADMDGELPEPIFVYYESPYFFPDGGWVAAEVSDACIRRAAVWFATNYKAQDECVVVTR